MDKDWIKSQIAELEKLLERCKDSEIMRASLQFRIDEFKKELQSLSAQMTRGEEAAKKKYPMHLAKAVMSDGSTIEFDASESTRNVFKLGYEQAEKDILATIESRISEILGDAQPNPALRAELQELIKRIKE